MTLLSGRHQDDLRARVRAPASDGRPGSAVALPLVLALMLLLCGCNTSAIYQDDLYNPPVYWGTHVVKKGENLYRIAWRYGRDYRELGNANGLAPPWKLRAGQVLRLDRKGRIPETARTASAAPNTATAPQRTVASQPPRSTAPPPKTTSRSAAPATGSSQTR